MSNTTEQLKMQLDKLVGEFVSCAESLQDCLIEERDALRRQDATAITALAARKKSCILKLEELEEARAQIGEACGFGRSPAATSSVAQSLNREDNDPAVLHCWRHFTDLARNCFDLNSSNGAIIRVRRMQITNSLSTLRGVAAHDPTYGPAGAEPVAERARSLTQA